MRKLGGTVTREQMTSAQEVLEHDGTQGASSQVIFERAHYVVERRMVESAILSGLHYSAVRWMEQPELLERGVACYKYLSGRFYDQGKRGFLHLPLFLVLDLLALIELGDRTPFASERLAHTWEPYERHVRVDYENLLLGTLLQEMAFVDARERLALNGSARVGASQRLVELLLQSFGTFHPLWLEFDPAHLRDFALPPIEHAKIEEHTERFDAHFKDPNIFLDGLRSMLSGISHHVYWRELLKTEDLFEIEHWAVLDSEATRIGVRQITEVERRLGEVRLPRVRLRDEEMEVETDFTDDTTFPTGGFSGLVNRGSFENLVRSELVYMGEGDPVSLFEMRYVEGELLYYMRNDGVMRRKRRCVHVIVDLDVTFHYKSPGYEYPFSTLTQGMITRLVRDLLATFEEDAVHISIHYVYRPQEGESVENIKRDKDRVDREMSLLALVLGREVRQECVSLDLVDDIDLEILQESKGRVYAVAFVFNKKSEHFWRGLFDDLEHARPPVFGLTVPMGVAEVSEESLMDEIPIVFPLKGLDFTHVAEIKNELFGRMMGGRR